MIPVRNTVEQLHAENTRLKQRLTELEQTIADLRPYRALFERIPLPMMLFYPDGSVATLNPAMEALLNIAGESLIETYNVGTHPHALETGHAECFQKAQAGEVASIAAVAHHPARAVHAERADHEPVWTESTYFPLYHEAGGISHVVSMNQDVTERRRAEEEVQWFTRDLEQRVVQQTHDLHQNRSLLREIIDHMPAAISVRDRDQRYLLINRHGAALLHSSPDQIVGQSVYNFFPAEIVHTWRETDRAILETGKTIQGEETLHVQERVMIQHSITFPIATPQGEISAIGEIRTDMTERKRRDEELRETEQFVRGVLDALTAHIAVLDETGTIIAVNEAWRMFTELNAQNNGNTSGTGANYLHVCDSADGACSEEAHDVSRAIRMVLAGERENFELIYPCHSPTEERWFLVRVSRFDNDGVKRAVVAHYNITEQHRAEQERVALQDQIIQTQQAVISELSTPLLPIAHNIIALPLIGSLDSHRAQHIMTTLLDGITTRRAHTAIIDITGIKVVDTQVAQALVQTAQAVRLLGARVVLTGIQPSIAQTLVQLGADLKGILTYGTLEAGINYALNRR